MLLLFLAAAASTPPVSTPALMPPPEIGKTPVFGVASASAQCPPISRYEAAKRGGKLKPDLLTELPTADLYKAVYRRVGGCIAPVIVRFGVGR
ncbi:MAG TPA: hypothetical protein VE820_09770 [Sphingomicrobium sp.]|jgi:hypothetical protein|nr:hypothetical protein [Sphingomicrobium sp.]